MRNISLAIAVISVFVIASCKKTEDTPASRLFRPVISGQLQADSNTIMAAWQLIKGAKSYQFELSHDTFKTIDLHLDLDTNAVVIKNLNFNQFYQVQVKAIAPDTVLNSKWSYLGTVKTLSSMLNVPDANKNEISDIAVKVSWIEKGLPPTDFKILKTSDSSVVKQISLTPTDVANKYRIVSGLQPATKYTIFLYSGTTVRGWADFTTFAAESGTIIDLRGITGRPNVLTDTIPFVASGAKILLDRTQTYNVATSVSLGKSLTIKSGSDLSVSTQASLLFTNNFNFAAGAVIDSIEFNDVAMKSDNYTSRYIFNTTNSATVSKLKFLNSKMEIFRGVCRLQSGTTTVDKFIVNNCIVDSISNYGILTVDNTTCKANDITITNSTVYKTEKLITSTKQTTGSNSVTFSNCTFNEDITGSNAYIDYGAFNVTNPISVTNCIFGVVKGGGTVVRDVKVGTSTSINSSNNYRTSDYVSGGAANDLPNVSVHNQTSLQTWVDPVNGNFKFATGSTYPAKTTTGDPRWR